MIVSALAALVVLQRPISPRSLATVLVDGRPLAEAGRIRRGAVQVPMRAVFEALGATVDYEASTQRIEAKTRRKTIRLTVGERVAFVPERTTLNNPPTMIGGKVYVPLRFVSESLGSLVRWEPGSRTVYVETRDREGRPGGIGRNDG